MLPLRRVSVVLMVLGLLCALGVGTASAKAKPKQCAKGQVRLTATSPCVKPKAKRGGAVTVSTPAARFQKLAGKRGVTAAAAAVKALQAAKKPARARAAEVQEDVEDGQWHPREVDGHPGRYRTTKVQTEGDALNNLVDSTNEVTVPAGDGAEVTTSLRTKLRFWFVACPDANGVVKGRTEEATSVRKTASRGGRSAFVEESTSTTTEITVQVNDDADIATATYEGVLDVEARATGAGSRRYILRWADDTQGPDVKDRDRVSAFTRAKTDPEGALAGTYRGPRGATFTAEEEQMLIKARLNGQDAAEGLTMQSILYEMRAAWQEDGRCVKLTLDPHAMTLGGGETGTFTATAKLVKDGSPTGGKVREITAGGEADHPDTAMAPGQPLTVKFTMGDGDKGTLIVEVRSKRGMGTDIVEIQRPQGWSVTYEADATFTQQRAEHGDTDTTTLSLHFKADYPRVFFDGGAFVPLGGVTIGGTMATKGTLGTGSYSCTGKPGWAQAVIQAVPAANGAMDLTLIPFTAVTPNSDSVDCDREGYGGDYGNVSALENAAPYAAHVTVTKDMRTQPEFSVPVTLGTGFPANCGQGPTVTCSESGTLTGTVRFKRQ